MPTTIQKITFKTYLPIDEFFNKSRVPYLLIYTAGSNNKYIFLEN